MRAVHPQKVQVGLNTFPRGLISSWLLSLPLTFSIFSQFLPDIQGVPKQCIHAVTADSSFLKMKCILINAAFLIIQGCVDTFCWDTLQHSVTQQPLEHKLHFFFFPAAAHKTGTVAAERMRTQPCQLAGWHHGNQAPLLVPASALANPSVPERSRRKRSPLPSASVFPFQD